MTLFTLLLRIMLAVATLYAFGIGFLMYQQNFASARYFLWVGFGLLTVILLDIFVQKQKI